MKQSCYRRCCGHTLQYTKAERNKLVLRAPRSRPGNNHSAAGHRFRNFVGKSGRGK